jgi:hypothetical protein
MEAAVHQATLWLNIPVTGGSGNAEVMNQTSQHLNLYLEPAVEKQFRLMYSTKHAG